MPLHISRIEIENFRNFKRLLIDPFPSTAVVVGENNVGKSNLLMAIRLLLDPDLPDSARSLREEDFYDSGQGPCLGESIRIAVELKGFDEDVKAMAVLADCLISDEPAHSRIEYVYELKSSIDLPDDELDDEIGDDDDEADDEDDNEGDDNEEVQEPSIDDYEWVVYGGPEEECRAVRFEPRRYIGVRVLPAMRDATDELRSRRSPLRELLSRTRPESQVLSSVASEVTAAVEELLEDDAMSSLQDAIRMQTTEMVGPAFPALPTLGIAPAVPAQLLRQIRLYTDQTRRRGMLDTSLGIANILYLALLLQAVSERRGTDSHVTTILGVEEPEAHLHVQIQRRLFGYLLRAEPAILLTSHSPHIAAVAPLDSIVLLRETDEGTAATTAMNVGFTEEEKEDIERYLDATRAELLFARFVILVEGDAERHVIPAIASAYGFDLTEYGISVVSVQGTDFGPYRSLLGASGLDIPHIAITDGDRRDQVGPSTTDGILRGLRLMSNQVLAKSLRAELGFPARPRAVGHVRLTGTFRRLRG
ncbi:AAA family ATPase [Asanoa sp. WMMD1127]|uniref:ATP-dependent nuclease n=1 Tax=Asanoa sp. WMMD1127 TaxID=3016107 RepID=UPI0024170DEB|nr:AAA family ATPase [Asanoa sp. WMMD1127]MDG4824917.1 AAA family ATPase [Asanoa sp. WMMD1127]